MKPVYFIFLFLLSMQVSACNQGNSQTVELDYNLIASDSLFKGIQDKIFNAFVSAMLQEDVQPVLDQEKKLTEALPQSPQIGPYWLAYNYFYKAIFFGEVEDYDNSEAAVLKGIEILEAKERKNAEDLALLAYMQSFSIQFVSGMKAGIISNRCKKNGLAAIDLDPENLRAHYVLGSIDYYTPAQYGGGKKAETYFRKAIELPDQRVANPYLPSWGKEDAYVLLIELLLEQERKEEAVTLYKEGVAQFPDSYRLGEVAKLLI